MFCFLFFKLNILNFSHLMFQNFQIKVFFEKSFDMNGGKEEAAKLDKSLSYCKEIAEWGNIIFFP